MCLYPFAIAFKNRKIGRSDFEKRLCQSGGVEKKTKNLKTPVKLPLFKHQRCSNTPHRWQSLAWEYSACINWHIISGGEHRSSSSARTAATSQVSYVFSSAFYPSQPLKPFVKTMENPFKLGLRFVPTCRKV